MDCENLSSRLAQRRHLEGFCPLLCSTLWVAGRQGRWMRPQTGHVLSQVWRSRGGWAEIQALLGVRVR